MVELSQRQPSKPSAMACGVKASGGVAGWGWGRPESTCPEVHAPVLGAVKPGCVLLPRPRVGKLSVKEQVGALSLLGAAAAL